MIEENFEGSQRVVVDDGDRLEYDDWACDNRCLKNIDLLLNQDKDEEYEMYIARIQAATAGAALCRMRTIFHGMLTIAAILVLGVPAIQLRSTVEGLSAKDRHAPESAQVAISRQVAVTEAPASYIETVKPTNHDALEETMTPEIRPDVSAPESSAPGQAAVIGEKPAEPEPLRLARPAVPTKLSGWFIQVSAPDTYAAAETISQELKLAAAPSVIQETEVNGAVHYRVLVGPMSSREQARMLFSRLKAQPGVTADAFIRRF